MATWGDRRGSTMGAEPEKVVCEKCKHESDYSQVHCRCGNFLGFPNYRAALAEQTALQARYAAARADAATRGVEALLSDLEGIAERALPTIAMPLDVCDLILRSDKYRNYSQRVARRERPPAAQWDHGNRMMVNERLFPNYGQHIVFAALSADGRGLASFGVVAMTWNVTEHYLGQRATLLEENSYAFFERHSLGGLSGAGAPSGYRAIWQDRCLLVTAKLASRLTPATARSSLEKLLFSVGVSKMTDDYVEVTIYAEDDGLDTLDVARVTLLGKVATPDENDLWARIEASCARRKIAVG